MKKIGFFLSILALLLPFTTASANDSATIRISEFHEGLLIESSHQSYLAFKESKMVKLQTQNVELTSAAGLCDRPTDAQCQKVGWSMHAVLPVCENEFEPYCIEGISLGGEEAKLLGYSPGVRIPRDPNFNMASGASTSIWQTRDNSGKQTLISGKVVVSSGSTWMNTAQPQFTEFQMELNLVEITNEKYTAPKFTTSTDIYGLTNLVLNQTVNQDYCYLEYEGKCVRKVNEAKQKFNIRVRISDLSASWFTGRMSDAAISITDKPNMKRVLSVTGDSVRVPEMKVSVPKADLAKNNPFIARGPVGDYYSQTATDALLFFGYLDENLRKNATSSQVFWSLKAPLGGAAGPCFTKFPGVGGFSTTNAMVYNLGNPVVVNGEMIYLIGSTHLDENGVENRGTYDLVLRSDIARCLYGLNSAPVKAEISVVSEDGQRQVATTTFGEKNGWLRVGAYNFTFSTPKIKVKLTQATKKTTIKCVKGKVMKSVSGAKPVCPTGYKKVG